MLKKKKSMDDFGLMDKPLDLNDNPATQQALLVVLTFMGDLCPFEELAPLRLTCKYWRDAVDNSSLTAAKTDACDSLAESCGRLRAAITTAKAAGTDKDRLELMEATLTHTDQIMELHWPPVCFNRRAELQMMARVARQFAGTAVLMENIASGAEKITVNFDAADMGLIRRVNEISTCRPPTASACIKDAFYKEKWDSTFGPHTVEVAWEDFCDRFVGAEVLCTKPPQFASHLKALTCFPEESSVTPYAVHLLSALYGPGNELWMNFSNLLLGHGFVGLVNMVHAKEMFTGVRDRIQNASYVLRYSRGVPEVFTVTTYNPMNGETSHTRNITPTLTLPNLLRKMERSGWVMAMFSMDGTLDTPSALSCSRVDRPLYVSRY